MTEAPLGEAIEDRLTKKEQIILHESVHARELRVDVEVRRGVPGAQARHLLGGPLAGWSVGDVVHVAVFEVGDVGLDALASVFGEVMEGVFEELPTLRREPHPVADARAYRAIRRRLDGSGIGRPAGRR